MNASELLAWVVPCLTNVHVPFMIAGSFASTLYGVPRTTQDLTVVIDPTSQSLNALNKALLRANAYVDSEVAHAAFRRRAMFNAITVSGWKLNFIFKRSREFSVSEFGRRVATVFLGTPVFVATAEDTIIAKLEWAKVTGSERQISDAAGIVAVAGGTLDQDYLRKWIEELGLGNEWASANEEL